MKIPQVRAKGILIWWGKFRFLYGHVTFYLTGVSLFLAITTNYNTTMRDWAFQYFGIELSLWVFAGIIIAGLVLGLLFEFVVSIPAIIATANEQTYKHENPVKADFIEVKNELLEIKKQLQRMEEKQDDKPRTNDSRR